MKKIVILLLVLCFVLCGCSKAGDNVDNTENQLSEIAEKLGVIADALEKDEPVAAPEDEIGFDEEDDISEDDFIDDSTDAETPSSYQSHSSQTQAVKTTNSVPSSVEEIVKLFSNSANAVKKDKPGFTIVETPTVGEVSIGKGSASLVNALKNAAMKLVKPSEKSAKKGEDHRVFPVEGESWACKLDASFVKKAECKKSGSYYLVSIYLKDEVLSELPKKHEDCMTGRVLNILTEDQIGDILGSIPLLKIDKFAPTYTGCYINCKINAKTGKMTEATYYMNNIVNIHANKSIEGSVDFAITQEIRINY